MEIGSIFEINPKCIEIGNKEKQGELLYLNEVKKYGKTHTAYTASGREAISLALKSLEKESPFLSKKCLLPAYMCDTVFFPFEQNGWEIHFYHVGLDLSANSKELCKLINEIEPDLLFIHAYYGVDTWKALRPRLHGYQESGLIIMEDMTQSYYMQDVDTEADYIVGSLRKWYSIPDGGFVTTNKTLYREIITQDEYFVKERIRMLTDKWKYLNNLSQLQSKDVSETNLQNGKEAYLALNRKMEEYLDANIKVTEMSKISAGMLMNLSEAEHFKRRNRNYRTLYKGFLNRDCVKPVFSVMEEQAAPLYFPVYAKDREKLQEFFCKNEIYVPVLWPVGKENEAVLSEEETYIFSHILAIPMDHRYGDTEMQKIIAVLDEYERIYR